MGLSHSPSIITDGLVLALDAGNTKSYNVGISSTTWSNSMKIGIGTLVNMDGSNYESVDGGSLSFNGTNQYVGFGSDFYSLDLSDKTFQCWIKKEGSSQKGLIDKEFDTGESNYGGWGFWT